MSNKLDILSVAKKQKNNSNNKVQTNSQPQSTILTSNSINAIDEAFFYGNSDNSNPYYSEPSRLYDPQEELRSLQEKSYLKNVNNSKLPKAILESIINNPIEISYDGLLGSTNIVTEDIQARSLDIIAKLDSRDKSKSINNNNNNNTESQPQTVNPINENVNNIQPIDLNQLGSLIENIIDNKLNNFLPKLLNESKNNSNNKMSIMKLGENFTFIDDSNNVYECKMIYKGKVKSKKK